MESDRPSISRSGERPVTRWRREKEPNDVSEILTERPNTGVSRPYSKMERPTSRRGVKTDITEFGISRPPTSGKNVLSRPPSPNIMSHRGSTAGSRINTANSANLPRMNSGLPRNFAQMNSQILDRPITQQGLTGVRPSSSKGAPRLARQIQDRRYYEKILNYKIRELSQEVTKMMLEADKENRERSASAHSDQRANEPNAELIYLQNRLAEYNMALNNIITGGVTDEVERELRELKEFKDREDAEMEHIFQKREQADSQLNELNKEIESMRTLLEKVENSMDSELKGKYDKARKEKLLVQKEIDKLQEEYHGLVERKTKLKEEIVLSPVKQEAYRYFVIIFESDSNRDKLFEEEKINSASKKDKESFKKIKRESVGSIDTEGESEKFEKSESAETSRKDKLSRNNNEFKNSEGIMENFMSAFEKNKAKELEKLSRLEQQIAERLEEISNSLDGSIDTSMLTTDEVEMLQTLMQRNVTNNSDKSFEELKQENSRLRQISKKLEALDLKIKSESKERNRITSEGQDVSVHNTETYRDIYGEKHNELVAQKEEITEHESQDNKEFEGMKSDYSKLREQLEENEIYRPISILEGKLEVALENDQFDQTIKEHKEHASLIEKLLALTAEYNSFLINDMKTVY